MRFAGRVLFITGAGSGLGRATARLFAAEGAKVFGVDVNGAGVAATVETIRRAGGVADSAVCDVGSMAAVRAAVGLAVAAFGGIDILVNAAGIGRAARLEEIEEDEWQRVLTVNLTGASRTRSSIGWRAGRRTRWRRSASKRASG